MVLDRGELAARAVAARAALLSLCDSLAALTPVAPDAPASGAPVAAPSPAPAATPAAWVPSVGDVVGIDGSKEYDETRVVTKIDRSAVSFVRLNANGGVICDHTTDVSLLTYLRRATSSERAAAGLPVDESATKPVDREGLARALRVAWWGEQTPATPWDELHPNTQAYWLTAADAAIAFMAKGGA